MPGVKWISERVLRSDFPVGNSNGPCLSSGLIPGDLFTSRCIHAGTLQDELRHYEQALAADPDAAKKLSHAQLLILARTALLASAGKGIDPPPIAERPKYRAKALASLRNFITAQEEALPKDFKTNRISCQKSIRTRLLHKDVASVRHPALNDLPEGERPAWESFWSEVDDLLQKADVPNP